MIRIRNVQTLSGTRETLELESRQNITVHAEHLLALPGLIDPHVHFRTPGFEYKEDWCTGARASLKGGYTTVFDMPNTSPPTVTQKALEEKKALIDAQLRKVNIPLRYHLFFGADKHHFDQIAKVNGEVVGIKVFMGCSTGNLLIDDNESLETIFKLAAEERMLVAVHAEDEQRLDKNKKRFFLPQPYAAHSQIRDEESASIAVKKAIELSRLYNTSLYILHVSTRQEIDLIAEAKASGLPVFAETSPHHLFLSTHDYDHLQGKGVMNPPLRTKDHQEALFGAIRRGIIDTVGSDHAPHTLREKKEPYGTCPSGVPGIETTLPLLLEAYHEGLLSLENIVDLSSRRAQEIFKLDVYPDYVLIDLKANRRVEDDALASKCKWSPFSGRTLKAWPVYTILNGCLYDLSAL